jgi:aminoglycoside 3-N-acetyltransferase
LKSQLSQKDIVDGLKQLGLERGMSVEVHSSLSSMGFVTGGASTVISALIDVIGREGAIVMSAYRVTTPLVLSEEEKAKGVIAKVQYIEENEYFPTGMG